jgi:hypothetical protein
MPSGFLANTSPFLANLSVPSVWLNAGEQIRINFQVLYDGNVQWQSNVNKILVGMVSKRTVSGGINRIEIKPSVTTNYGVNSVIKLAKMLPQMKMRDLFINIIKMFNLMVVDNPDVDNDLIIEPRDEFFNSKRKVNDWTYKLDYDQDIVQTPMSELDTKTYKFTYDSDDDHYNKTYQQQTSRIYGDLVVDFLNDFSNETKELKLELAPTPITDNIISPLVAPFFCEIDTSNALNPIKVKPRIVFTKKKALTNQFFVITDNPNQSGVSYSSYMYAGMYDDPFDPEHSLEFGNSNVLYYNTSMCCPSNTLVNQFYLTTLNDITDVNSKLLEAYFHLTPSDMNKFDFRDIILIDNSYWRVNRIVDYNPNAIDRTTKVILYKLNYLDIFYNNNKELALTQNTCPSDVVLKKSKYGYIYVSLSNAAITQDCCNLWGGIWNNGYCVSTQPVINKPGGGLPYADPKKQLLVSDNQITTGSIFLERPFQMLKNLNVINSDTVLVKGENNYVDQGASNSMILGSNNSIPFGVKNSLVIGDNINRPIENSIVVGDILISSNGIEYYNVYKIDGGFETVMYDGKTNLIDIIDGTFESVRNYGGDSKLRVIISGANAQTETDFEDV